ncbi:MAG: hypothetical protein LKG11_00045 [Bacilli bacterium]|jgi:Na+/melibiose symporter-like transporter|nr:hypothetical protein [Bacilli bacterium]
MDNQQTPHDPLAEFRSRLNLYSYVCQIVFVFLDLLVAGVSLIVAHGAGVNLVYLWVGFGGAVFSLILIAVLSALYFVGDEEERNSLGRIKASLSVRMGLRIVGLLIMAAFLLHLGLVSQGDSNWGGFLYVYSVLGLIVSGLALIYSIWKAAWIKENPERYQSVYGRVGAPREVAKKEPKEKDFSTPSPKKKRAAKKKKAAKGHEVIEVDSHEKN